MSVDKRDPYQGCGVYLEHGACVCSTGYPASCQATAAQPAVTADNAPTVTPCAGSGVWADGPYWEFTAVCPGCYQLAHIRPDGDSYRFLPHVRELPVNPSDDRLAVPERKEAA